MIPAPRPTQLPATRIAGLSILGIGALAFWDSLFLAPFKLLVVTFHELGHATTALLTGGSVVELVVNVNEGGHTLTSGGSHFLILNGGYLGSLVFGMLLLASVRSQSRGRLMLGLLGVGLWAIAGLWVPLFSFGFVYIVLMGLGFLVASRKAPEDVAGWAVRGLGVFSILYALFDIRSDVFGGVIGNGGTTDATMLAEKTGIPGILWGVAWLCAGLLALWRARHRIL